VIRSVSDQAGGRIVPRRRLGKAARTGRPAPERSWSGAEIHGYTYHPGTVAPLHSAGGGGLVDGACVRRARVERQGREKGVPAC
jgi:hypothetical protein